MWIDASGHKLRHTFHRAMMRSAARLTYNQVQQFRDGGPGSENPGAIPAGLLDPLYGAFAALQKSRESRGAIDLDPIQETPWRDVLTCVCLYLAKMSDAELEFRVFWDT